MEHSPKFAPEPFLEALHVDPNNLPDLSVFSGHLGESARSGYVRLYRNPTLSAFLEIPVEEIVHTERLGSGPDRLSSTVLWVRAGAAIDAVTVQPRSARQPAVARRLSERRVQG
jgi:hypothetical protein